MGLSFNSYSRHKMGYQLFATQLKKYKWIVKGGSRFITCNALLMMVVYLAQGLGRPHRDVLLPQERQSGSSSKANPCCLVLDEDKYVLILMCCTA